MFGPQECHGFAQGQAGADAIAANVALGPASALEKVGGRQVTFLRQPCFALQYPQYVPVSISKRNQVRLVTKSLVDLRQVGCGGL